MLVKGYPKTLHHPNGYETVTVRDEVEEERVRARMSGRPEPSGRDTPLKPVMRRKGRTPNVRNQ
ncbi:hypothetical protein NBRC103581_00500 [Gluconobacter wancherniae NBRC 103581]|uniref:Uncharacterized protein n=1 Tax=Gluconobacter wancherniae NBRC 103581 TaxID=656744 RepID=A0A511AY83_9PROT|nr:hypothetical protein [Gluconobacter wancherniae]GBD55928.1 hypothetical protein NBRC103581_00500 [Gluconobacter wancherniae NBRC 103581]GBR65873.1 hypothetical protein AA103581_2051 [Gluconobacter wancherniae NBRC 103581]GEK93168.1 hypothetical protein GWA01_09380 [Gluconobacter wancherniae NBRC 103581]